MAKADAEPRGPEVHIEQAIGRLYRFLAGNRWTRFPWAVVQTFSKAEGALLSGSMAYYTFLSLLPLLMVAAFVIATFASPGPDARATVAEALNQVFPGIGTEVFEDVIDQVVVNRAALGVFGLLSVAYAGSGFVGSMTACLNRMWQLPSGRNPVGQKIVNIIVVMLLGSVLLGSALLTIWVSATAQETLNLGPTSPVISMIEEVAAPASIPPASTSRASPPAETGGGTQGEDAIWSHRWYTWFGADGPDGAGPQVPRPHGRIHRKCASQRPKPCLYPPPPSRRRCLRRRRTPLDGQLFSRAEYFTTFVYSV